MLLSKVLLGVLAVCAPAQGLPTSGNTTTVSTSVATAALTLPALEDRSFSGKKGFIECIITSPTWAEWRACWKRQPAPEPPAKRDEIKKGYVKNKPIENALDTSGLVNSFLSADTVLSLINATPYRWRRSYIHSYQLKDWESQWPEYMVSGQAAGTWAKACWSNHNCGDSAGEVEYTFENTTRTMSLTFKYRNQVKGKPHISVEFGGALESRNNGKGSLHWLPFLPLPGGSGFVVAGTEGDFITNDGPIGWMQSMLPELTGIPLREIVLPRSHHAGLAGAKAVGLGEYGNSQLQTATLRHQMGNGGVRVLDFRAAKVKPNGPGAFRESHLTKIGESAHGMLGAKLDSMVDRINYFNDKWPGELVIIDVHRTAYDKTQGWKELSKSGRRQLYGKLKRLKYRINAPDTEDISRWPIERFIGNRTSAVIVNIDDSWVRGDPLGFPGGKEGFTTSRNLPLTHRWSNTDKLNEMVEDQVRYFKDLRQSRNSAIHIADWVLTQKGATAVMPEPALIDLTTNSWSELYGALWTESTSESYPNWVAVDHVQGNMHKSIIMAMNRCLVARKCGDLNGKVLPKREAEDEHDEAIKVKGSEGNLEEKEPWEA